MNLLDIERKQFKKYFSNDNFVRGLAIVLALLLFFTTNSTSAFFTNLFYTTKYIDEVPIVYNYDSENYVVDGLPSTISVKVQGSESSVNAVMQNKSNISAELEVAIDSEGIKTVDMSKTSFVNAADVDIEPITKEITVDSQKRINKDMVINYEYVNSSILEQGYMLASPTLSSNSVTISGGSQDIESIDSVKAIIDLSLIAGKTSGEQEITAPLVAYDSNGNVVDVEMNMNEISVTQAFENKTQDIYVSYKFLNLPENRYVSKVCYNITPEQCTARQTGNTVEDTVSVFGSKEAISELANIEYKIDFSNINTSENTVELKAVAILPENVYTTEPIRDVTVVLEEGESKTLTDLAIRVDNLDSNLTVKAKDSNNFTTDVKVTGPKSVIDNLEANDIIVYIDLSDIDSEGESQVPVRYKTNEYITVELLDETVDIVVTEKEN